MSLRTPCQICLDIHPSSKGPEYGECMRCGSIAHYMDFIQDMIHKNIQSAIEPNALLDFRAMPDDLAAIKAKVDELEKTLSMFAEILKSAIQT